MVNEKTSPKKKPIAKPPKALAWLMQPLLRIADRPLNAWREPVTEAERFSKDLIRSVTNRSNKVGSDAALREAFFTDVPDSEWAKVKPTLAKHFRSERKKLMRLRGGSEILELFDNANAAITGSAILAGLDTPQAEGALKTHVDFNDLRGVRRELRARKLVELAAHVGEHVYQPYLLALRKLLMLGSTRLPTPSPSFGAVVNELVGKVPAVLIEADGAHIRNACSHRKGYEIALKEPRITLRDVPTDSKKKTWTRTFTSRGLEALVREMARLCRQYHTAFGIIANERLLDHWLGLAEDLRATSDGPAIKRAVAKFKRGLDVGLFGKTALAKTTKSSVTQATKKP